MTKKLITILGITGTQGGSVAERFLAPSNASSWRVRGVTRNPASPKAQALTARGVEMVKADHDNLDALRAAFSGSHAIFAVTDWAGNYTRVLESADLQAQAKAAGRSQEEYAGDLERDQGVNIANAAADPSVLATLEKYVFSTLAAVKSISAGKYVNSWEFDSKAAAEAHVRENLPELARRLSTVTMGIFQETWRDIPAFRPRRLADGTFEYVRLKAEGDKKANPEVVASRDTGAFVEALVLSHPPGTDVLGASEIITKPDYAALWGRVMGVTATCRDVDEDEFLRFVPEGFEATLVDDTRFFSEFGYAGGNPRVKTPAELGIRTTSLEEWFRSQDWTEVLEGKI
ncbi:hypothetical protein N3K66_007197 [Trichothecium roseum]|uniref:Uncharacterized protein n=1 Tax=Trichothecium roseum TaxID=47278 RepID=A0ACC0UTB3_9HYPO|nr:hypothetical protein N3K66_007197 [Trichothecium roseum]